jgi:FAD/FMN-containing dehydrogenase
VNRNAAFIKEARAFLSESQVLTDPQECSNFGSDWSRLSGAPFAVALPESTAQVAALLKLCSELKIAVVPSGGRTGLVGGAVAGKDSLVLSLARMHFIHKINTAASTVRVQAGATTQAVHEQCEPHGLIWPIELASKGSCQIGGNLATNAGGLRVIRYGMARKWVNGLQIVTAAGNIIELNRQIEKNNTGYDLIQLVVGSEGTLAVITEATLRLTTKPQASTVFFFGVDSIEQIVALLSLARSRRFPLLAFEFFSRACLRSVEKELNRASRLNVDSAFYVIVEMECALTPELELWTESLVSSKIITDGLIAHSSDERKQVWSLREGITESLSHRGGIRKYDLSLPLITIQNTILEIENRIKILKVRADVFWFGHLGDGSPHLNIVQIKESTREDFDADCDRFETDLFKILLESGGSISAEHGVGLLKKDWITYSRTPEERAWFRAIKNAFDPLGILNPGKIID